MIATMRVLTEINSGANMAVEDAFLLAVLLAKRFRSYPRDGHQDTFYEFYRHRSPHVSRVAKESYQQSKMGQWTHPLLVLVREWLLRNVPTCLLHKKLKAVNLWDVNPWLQDFRTACKSK